MQAEEWNSPDYWGIYEHVDVIRDTKGRCRDKPIAAVCFNGEIVRRSSPDLPPRLRQAGLAIHEKKGMLCTKHTYARADREKKFARARTFLFTVAHSVSQSITSQITTGS